MVPSAGSKAGQKFVGVGGPAIPNQGQLTPEMILESGDLGSINFQAAAIRKPLMAVTDCNKKKSPCLTGRSPLYCRLVVRSLLKYAALSRKLPERFPSIGKRGRTTLKLGSSQHALLPGRVGEQVSHRPSRTFAARCTCKTPEFILF